MAISGAFDPVQNILYKRSDLLSNIFLDGAMSMAIVSNVATL